MKKQIIIPGCMILCLAVFCTVFGTVPGKKTVAVAKNSTFAAGETESKSNGSGGIGAIVSEINGVGDGGIINGVIGEIIGDKDVSAGIGGVISGVADDLSGFLSGVSSNRNGNTSPGTTADYYEIETIAPMVTEEETTLQSESTTSAETETAVSTTYGLTVAEGTDEVPYEKPTAPLSSTEDSDGVRWMQWIFIYTDYGLRSDGITGVLDDDTVSCIKKLQQERGLKVDGEVNQETIDKIELLYLEKKLQGNTGQFITAAADTEPLAEAAEPEKSGINTVLIVVTALGIWTLVLGVVLAVIIIRKKKLQKDVKELDKKSAENSEKKDTKVKDDKKSNGGVESLSDLFQEAEERSKKKK